MPPRLSKKKTAGVAHAILDMDVYWSETFGDLGLNDLNYSDLFMQMWLHRDQPLRKTGLYDFMPGISRRTAVKYVQGLIDRGLLQESAAAGDRRVRFISLSEQVTTRLEQFLSFSYERFRRLE